MQTRTLPSDCFARRGPIRLVSASVSFHLSFLSSTHLAAPSSILHQHLDDLVVSLLEGPIQRRLPLIMVSSSHSPLPLLLPHPHSKEREADIKRNERGRWISHSQTKSIPIIMSSSPSPPFEGTKRRGTASSNLRNREGRIRARSRRRNEGNGVLRSERISALMKIENRGTHLIDIDSAQGQQVLDFLNLASPSGRNVRQKGLQKGQKLHQATHQTKELFCFLGDAAA